MKRDIYAHITTAVLASAIGFSLFLVISDNRLPFTTQATVKTPDIQVFPEVTGAIEEIFVTEGEQVSAGTALMQIDPTNYELARQKAAANELDAKAQWLQAKRHFSRLQNLNSVSQEVLDDADIAVQNAFATLKIRQTELKKAEHDLENTLVVARKPGIVTNMSYREGMYVTPATSVVHLIDKNSLWIAADFTEKGLAALDQNKEVNIVFDAYPMRVFQGQIVSIDSAITSGVESTGQLATIQDEGRWIRSQQKIRVRIAANIEDATIVAGGRASVMLRDNHGVSNTWMTLLSWMRYIY